MGAGARKKRQKAPSSPLPLTPRLPTIFEAKLTAHGSGTVFKVSPPISQAQAVVLRQQGRDIVVCGPVLADNYALAWIAHEAGKMPAFPGASHPRRALSRLVPRPAWIE